MNLFHFNYKQEDLFCSYSVFLEQSLIPDILALAKFLHNLVGYPVWWQFDIVEESALVFVTTDWHHLHGVE